jgi:hypothetical protein
MKCFTFIQNVINLQWHRETACCFTKLKLYLYLFYSGVNIEVSLLYDSGPTRNRQHGKFATN